MIERGEHLRFALEAREPIGIEREGVGQHLQRDVAIELACRARDTPRPCRPRRAATNFIGTEASAGSERHVRGVTGFYFSMCARSFSFSLQTYSSMSVSGSSRSRHLDGNGFVYISGSSIVTSCRGGRSRGGGIALDAQRFAVRMPAEVEPGRDR